MPVTVTNTETHGDDENSLASIYLRVRENALPARAFVEAAQGIDWRSRDVNELADTIWMAIQLELIPLARTLAKFGTERYPESERIRKFWNMVRKDVPAIIAPENRQLDDAMVKIANLYHVADQNRVRNFLAWNEQLIAILVEAHEQIAQVFERNPEIDLEIVRDPEISNFNELFVYIRTDLGAEAALEKLHKFDDKWFLNIMDQTDNKLTFSLRFV